MSLTTGYILLLAKQPYQVRILASILGRSDYSVAIANSEEQAVAQTVQHPPFLIILAGEHHNWSQAMLRELRTHANLHHITLVALTDFHAPSWIHQEENPGFDGFLVNPISSEILSSLVQSAYARQTCYATC
ncbi:response regulator [Leptolyngbya sp. FACHB-36]|uniref:response regulator n=1 Tax=Leptolyngbya sp. FACHB-36 TaxID=2692808 RepID=UPI001999E273|nr:response regulator [Leptolyngbya sp. FACHB-36]MBD2019868.1 response regulator [Leptolyngbya sp. FACHB-36]